MNISAGEAGSGAVGPEGYGSTYIYPQLEEIDHWASKGFGCIRMPFLMQRLTQKTFEPLSSAQDINAIKGIIDRAFAKNMYVILDLHEYAVVVDFRMPNNRLCGSGDPEAIAIFADLWQRLATKFKNCPNVIFELQNEPVPQSYTVVTTGSDALYYHDQVVTLAATRAVGANQLVLLTQFGKYSGAHWWDSGGIDNTDWNAFNQPGWTGLNGDPANNFMFAVHQYLDPGDNGTGPTVNHGYGAAVLDADARLQGHADRVRLELSGQPVVGYCPRSRAIPCSTI